MGKLILTSYGLTTKIGKKNICPELMKENLSEKRIFLFHEPFYSIRESLLDTCLHMGFQEKNIFFAGEVSAEEVRTCDFMYVTEGNTFEVLSLIRENGYEAAMREAFLNGAAYIGASAGAAIAGKSIEHVYYVDRNHILLKNLDGLGLFDGIVFPHLTQEELDEYVRKNSDIKEKYSTIFSIEEDGIIILER